MLTQLHNKYDFISESVTLWMLRLTLISNSHKTGLRYYRLLGHDLAHSRTWNTQILNEDVRQSKKGGRTKDGRRWRLCYAPITQ